MVLSQATPPVTILETLWLDVPYRTSRVPVNVHEPFSVAHWTQLLLAVVEAVVAVVVVVAVLPAEPVGVGADDDSAPIPGDASVPLPPPHAVAIAAQSRVRESRFMRESCEFKTNTSGISNESAHRAETNTVQEAQAA